MTISRAVGLVLYAARTDRGLSQYEVAEAAGMSQSAYSKAERGKTNVSIRRLHQIARVFDVRLSEILRRAEELPMD